MRYFVMQKALNQSGRPIFYSIFDQGQDRIWEWAGSMANSWGTSSDLTITTF